MLCRITVHSQAVITTIDFGDCKAYAVARLYVERFAHGSEQRSPRVERDRARREGGHHIWREADVFGEHVQSRV